MKKIGIYGGSFDPIHLGHLNLAVEIMETHQLDQVWFCPTAINPLKNQSQVSSQHRLNMLRLAIEKEPRFKISELEINRTGLSYTIDTLNELNALHNTENEHTFSLILGEDAAHSFHQWKQPEEIVKLVPIFIGARQESEGKPGSKHTFESFQGNTAVKDALNRGLTKTRIMEISSQEIRKRLFNKKYCYHLVPAKVMDYIITNHLYSLSLNETRFL